MFTPSFARKITAVLGCCVLPSFGFAANNIISGSGTIVANGAKAGNNDNLYDQVLLTGPSAVLRTDGTKILRASFLDPNGDIVQCEFSGPGQFTIELEDFVAAAPAAKYNQPTVSYVTGRPTVKIDGNTVDTYVNIFSVGKQTAINQALFPAGMTYDGIADVKLLQISGSAIASVLTGNTRFSGSTGLTGIFAPNTNVKNRAVLHDIKASSSATPVLQFGSGSTFSQDAGAIRLAGGNLIQPNNASIDVTAGSGATVASIVTTANIRSDGTEIVRTTVSSTVTWISGGTGTVKVDGTAVVNTSTGGSTGSFAATFSEMLASSNSPFKFDGNVNVKWVFSGGNNGTWSVETTTVTQGLSIKSTISGTYTYAVTNGGAGFSFTMNYDQISTNTGFGPPLTINITAGSNPPMPKTIAMTATSTAAGAGSYQYTLTMSNGQTSTFSGNYTPGAPLGLPTS